MGAKMNKKQHQERRLPSSEPRQGHDEGAGDFWLCPLKRRRSDEGEWAGVGVVEGREDARLVADEDGSYKPACDSQRLAQIRTLLGRAVSRALLAVKRERFIKKYDIVYLERPEDSNPRGFLVVWGELEVR
jgi:hypothetical protein